MAKKKSQDEGLPYFKFFASKWTNGSIDDCSLAAQGLFVNLCVKYWGRRGDITLSGMKSKFKRKEKLFTELISRDVVKVIDDKLEITFLDDQLQELGVVSETNSKNAKSRWNKTKTDAVASESHSERSADAMLIEREEKREDKEEKRIEESESDLAFVDVDDDVPRGLKIELPDKAEITKEIFEDELFTEELRRSHPKKDIPRAWEECWLYHSQKPSPPTLGWQWRQKLSTWLINTKPEKKYASSARTLTETSPDPGKDYSEKF